MSFLNLLSNVANNLIEKAYENQAKQMGKADDGSRRKREYGGKTLRQWESSWKSIGTLTTANLSSLSNYVGLYRASLGSEIVYIGRATEYSNGGLRKRLSDYTRKSNSARKHNSGRLMHKHADDLRIEVLITGSDAEAANIAKQLERCFIGKYKPKWNVKLF